MLKELFFIKFRVIFIFLILGSMSHCGFVLKRDANFSEKIPEIFISQSNVDARFINLLEKSLVNREVVVSPTAIISLNIISYTEQRRAASINSTNANQIETQIRKALVYSVSHIETGQLLISPNTIAIHKEYINDNSNIAGKAEEEILIREELDREMVTRLLRRLDALPPLESIRFTENQKANRLAPVKPAYVSDVSDLDIQEPNSLEEISDEPNTALEDLSKNVTNKLITDQEQEQE